MNGAAGRRRLWIWASGADPWIVGIVAVAVVLRAWPWLKPHVFTGAMEYDDGVYYAAARALLHGLVPYRDVTIVHPPLTAVVLLPFAALGAAFGDPVGMAAARVVWLVVGCVNVVLVHRLARRVCGGARSWPALGAAALYAVAPAAVGSERTILLEPLTNLLVLASMLVLTRRSMTTGRVAVAGALAGLAVGVKAFAVAYVVAVVAYLVLVERRRIAPYAAGLTVALVAVFGPFVALAGPGRVWRDVVTTQLGRPADGGASDAVRLQRMFGLGSLPLALALAFGAACVGVWTVLAVRAQHRRTIDPLLLFWAAVTGLVAIAFLRSPSYFDHYAAFFVPPLAITMAGVVARASKDRMVLRAAAAATVTALVVPAVVRSVGDDARWPASAPLSAAAGVIPRGACIYVDAVSLAIAADRVHEPSSRCPGWIDGRGQNLVWTAGTASAADFYPRGFLADARWQRDTLAQIEASSFLLVRTDPTRMPEWTEVVRSYVAQHFRLAWAGGGHIPAQLWRRVG